MQSNSIILCAIPHEYIATGDNRLVSKMINYFENCKDKMLQGDSLLSDCLYFMRRANVRTCKVDVRQLVAY